MLLFLPYFNWWRETRSECEYIAILSPYSCKEIIAISGSQLDTFFRSYQQTLYHWKKKFGGMDISETRRLKELELENSKLKRIVADQALDIVMLKDVNSKK